MPQYNIVVIVVAVFMALSSQQALAQAAPNDVKATAETVALFHSLRTIAKEKILFGQHDSTLRGIGWQGGDGVKSDIKELTGKSPAIYSWDLNPLPVYEQEDGSNLMRDRIIEAYDRGGINTISWHLRNPVTGKDFYDTTETVSKLIPGGSHHEDYIKLLDMAADFLKSLKGKNGEYVPIIFRPFHEHTGRWFWWGKGNASEEDYQALWRYTVNYFQNEKKLHHVLYAYSPAKILKGGKDAYLWGYPGDDYIDVLGYDHYTQDITEALPILRLVVSMAAARGKVAALTETGIPKGLSKAKEGNYYTERLLMPLKNDPIAQQIAFMVLWRNRSKESYWVPYPDHPLAADFQAMSADPLIGFERDLPEVYTAVGKN